MQPSNQPSELNYTTPPSIGLAEVLVWFNKSKWLLIAFSLAAAITAGIVSYFIPPTYESKAVLQPVTLSETGQGIGGRLGGLAGVLGGGGVVDDTTVTLALFRSKNLIQHFIEEEKLLPDLFPERWDEATQTWKENTPPSQDVAVRIFSGQVTAVKNKDGLIDVSVRWNSAEKAQSIAQKFVKKIDNSRRLQAKREAERNLEYLYNRLRGEQTHELRNNISMMIAKEMHTVMRAESPSDYALKMIDPPLVPEFRSSPKRTLLVIFGAIFGFAAGIITVFIRQSLRNKK